MSLYVHSLFRVAALVIKRGRPDVFVLVKVSELMLVLSVLFNVLVDIQHSFVAVGGPFDKLFYQFPVLFFNKSMIYMLFFG